MSIETREDAVKIIANQMLGIINKDIDQQGVFQFYWGEKPLLWLEENVGCYKVEGLRHPAAIVYNT